MAVGKLLHKLLQFSILQAEKSHKPSLDKQNKIVQVSLRLWEANQSTLNFCLIFHFQSEQRRVISQKASKCLFLIGCENA